MNSGHHCALVLIGALALGPAQALAQGALRLADSSLPEAAVGRPYSARLVASGGTAPYAYQALQGTPSWMRVVSDGSISGTPDAPGHHVIHVSVFDSRGQPLEGQVELDVVMTGPLALDSTASDFRRGVVGASYDVAIRAHGGMAPYTFEISSGNLPAGLALQGSRVQGQPTSPGTSTFELRVSDSAGGSATLRIELEVIELAPLTIEAPDRIIIRPNAVAAFPLTARGGVPPYTWTVAGALPAGLVLDGDTLRGTPTSSRAASMVTLRATDAQPVTTQKVVMVDVKSSAPAGGGNHSRAGGCAVALPEAAPLFGVALVSLVLRQRRRQFFG